MVIVIKMMKGTNKIAKTKWNKSKWKCHFTIKITWLPSFSTYSHKFRRRFIKLNNHNIKVLKIVHMCLAASHCAAIHSISKCVCVFFSSFFFWYKWSPIHICTQDKYILSHVFKHYTSHSVHWPVPFSPPPISICEPHSF